MLFGSVLSFSFLPTDSLRFTPKPRLKSGELRCFLIEDLSCRSQPLLLPEGLLRPREPDRGLRLLRLRREPALLDLGLRFLDLLVLLLLTRFSRSSR